MDPTAVLISGEGFDYINHPDHRAAAQAAVAVSWKEMSRAWDALHDGRRVGILTDAVWSPGLRKNIGYVWVPIELAEPGTALEVVTERGDHLEGVTAAIPFVDPRKQAPAAQLA